MLVLKKLSPSMSIVMVLTAIWRRFELEAVDKDKHLVVESVGI